MEQQEKQAIRSQRHRRAVTCLKRKEREGGEDEDSEEEMPSPSKSSKESLKNSEGQKAEERSLAGGGFVASDVIVESPPTSLTDVCSTVQESLSVKAVPQPTKTLPQRARHNSSSSSSSGEDSDDGREVAMVTARSVFEANRRGRGAKGTRGRGSMRGKRRGKKL